jgi:hypothetical protein
VSIGTSPQAWFTTAIERQSIAPFQRGQLGADEESVDRKMTP